MLYFPNSHFLPHLDGWENIKIFTFMLSLASKMSFWLNQITTILSRHGKAVSVKGCYYFINLYLTNYSPYICHFTRNVLFNQGWPWLHIEVWFPWQPLVGNLAHQPHKFVIIKQLNFNSKHLKLSHFPSLYFIQLLNFMLYFCIPDRFLDSNLFTLYNAT